MVHILDLLEDLDTEWYCHCKIMSTNVEFAVNITDAASKLKLKQSLEHVDGVESVKVHAGSETVIVKSSLPISLLQEKIESNGQRAIIRGYGGTESGSLQAAVAMIGGECGYGSEKIQGVVRFIQTDESRCIVDGTIDGLTPGLHGLHIHEFGDISDGCDRVGQHFSLSNTSHGGPHDDKLHRHTGDLGNVEAGQDGRAHFRFTDSVLKVWDVIGRTVVVTEDADDLGRGSNKQSLINGNSGRKLGCGIIARSAGLFENSKRICACDGVSLWDEREKPLAGPGRRQRP